MKAPIDPVRLHEAREGVRTAIGAALKGILLKRYEELVPAPGEALVIDGPNAGKRRLRNACLNYLAAAKDATALKLCASHFQVATQRGCMTDKLAAFRHLSEMPEEAEAQQAVQSFYEDAK